MSQTTQKRSKNLMIIVYVLLAVLAVGAIAVSFVLNYNTFAPKAPVILDDGQNIYISTSMNDNYKGYRFKFVDESENQIIIESEKNQISVDELLENKIQLGKSYKVSVCYLAENVGNNSHYSKEISWKCQNYLKAPFVTYNKRESSINWENIDGVDYYRIYINGEDNYIETVNISYDLQQLTGGEKTINVVGYSNNENLLTSNKSNTINISLIHYLQPFTSITFDLENEIITAKSSVKYEKVNIYLGDTATESNLFDVVSSNNEYVYTINITTIYNGEEKIGITPTDIDQYNKYVGEILYFEVENS